MTDYTPFASLLLADCLASDPFGTVHRAIELQGPHQGRNVLVRRYHEHWIEAGLLKNIPEIQRNILHLGKLKLFQDVRLVRDEAPHFVWPLCQGRSLSRVIQEAEAQQIPFGLDQALFLAWILCHHITQLHQAGIALGFLTPHRIWVGFDGVVELLDAPIIQQMEQVLEACPDIRGALGPYLVGPKHEGIQRDAYQVGALLFEMLTHRPLPEARYLAKELHALQVQGPDGLEPLPITIGALMTRLLGLGRPFQNLEELERELEESLFGTEDFNPSSFGLAFTLHTLFRRELEAENQAMEEEQAEDGVLACRLAMSQEVVPAPARPRRRSAGLRLLLSAATLLAGLTTLAAWKIHGSPASHPETTIVTKLSTQSSPTSVPPQSPEPRMAPTPGPVEKNSEKPVVEKAAAKPTAQTIEPPAPKPAPAAKLEALPSGQSAPRLLQKPSMSGGSSVRLRVYVDEQGRVRQAFVLEGAAKGSERERTACSLAMGARFTPATDNGRPVRDWTEMSISSK